MPDRIYLSLGSNLGDRERHLQVAIESLAPIGVTVLRVSSLYETEPVGLREQPWFLNCVVGGESDVAPAALLRSLLELEQQLGRRRAGVPAMGPRTIDLDLVLYGDMQMETEELTLPHPRYRQRRFVLAGLAELAPELRDPVTGETMAELLAKVDDASAVVRVADPNWAPENRWA